MLSLTIYRQCTSAISYYEKTLATGTVRCIDSEIPFDIPTGWEWARIGDYTQLVTDFVASGSFASLRENVKYYDKPQYAVLVRTKDFRHDFKRDLVYTDRHAYDFLSNSNLFGGEIILPNIGASIGKVFVVPHLNIPMTLAPNSIMVRFTDEELKWWFYTIFDCNIGVSFLRNITSATAQGKFNKTEFKKILIPIPPKKEQERINCKLKQLDKSLNRYDSASNLLGQLNANITDNLKQSILQEAIQGRLVPQIGSEGTAEDLLAEVRAEKQRLVKEGKLKKAAIANESRIFRGDDNKYYEQIGSEILQIDYEYDFPKSWSIVRLSSVCSLLDGDKKEGLYICMDAKYLRGKSSGEYLNKGRFVADGQSIILVDGENSGEVFIVPHDGYMGSTFKQLWISERLYKPYILSVIRFYKDLFRQSKKGAAIPHLNKEVFNNLLIGLPPLKEQIRIVKQIDRLTKTLK